jgi:hypothetical protein
VRHLHRALRQAGAAGGTIDELFQAMRANGYTGDRLGVWIAVEWALVRDGSVVVPPGIGRCYSPEHVP